MGSLSDILTAIQNGVVAANNLVQQTKGTLTNINGQLATIPPSSSIVRTFNGRSSAVLPAQGDYPTNLIPGTSTNNNAAAGNIGEFVSSVIPSTSAIGVASAVTTSLTSVTLTAGDWDLRACLGTLPTSSIQGFLGAISSASSSFGDLTFAVSLQSSSTVGFQTGGRMAFELPMRRVSVSAATGSTTYYAIAQIVYGSSASIYGSLSARRPW